MINSGSRWRHRTSAALLAAVLGTTGFGLAAGSATAQEAPPAPAPADKQLDKQDREFIAKAEQAGQANVTLLVAAEEGKLDSAANDLKALGGVIESTERDVDYLKVSVPRDKAEKAAELASVNAVDVDGLVVLDDPRPDGATTPLAQPAPNAATPKTNPYMPTQDTKAAQFTADHPEWDGRGTTIAIMDTGIDLDHPALATTSTGERKIVDWYNANATNSGDGTWIQVGGRHTGVFTHGGATYTAPADGGPYSFGLFRETAGDFGLANSETGGDINRDGDRVDAFGVLQDITTKEVRVDVDGDGDFTDQAAMIDYKYKQDVGHFGADNPATPVLDTVAFVVQTDKSNYDAAGNAWVNLGISAAAHGSHVAGITAANRMFGGRMAGAAPGAKLMAVKVCLSTPSCTSSGLVDGLLYAARNGADVVNISIGGLPALNDGNNARARLYDRTIAEYNVQVFISAGNSGAGANTVGDPSVTTTAVSVGSYITADTWLSNYGSVTTQREGLHGFSSRGPREDGGFKPNIVAPGSAVSTTPQWQAPGPVAGTYTLPAGYAMFNGTSMAAPQAAGAAALLVSAYKAEHNGERPSVEALRNAIQSGARWVSTLQAYEQGAGLFDTKRAWTQLNAHPEPQAVTTSVAVNTALSGLLATPHTGVGIHDREGAVVGREYTRTYTLTRTTGPNTNQQFVVRWQGNDGTFSSRSVVNLPLNTPVTFDVKVKPTTAGAHSAVLKLDNLATRGIDVFTLNTVFAADEFTAAGRFAVTKSGTIARNQSKSFFVRVPDGASALKVDMAAGGAEAGKGQVRFLRYDPYGVPFDSTSSINCYNPDAGAGCAAGSPTSRTVSNPRPGVWEIVIEARRTSDADAAPFSMTASVLGTTVDPNPDTIASAVIGTPIERSYTVTNAMAGFEGRLVGGPLASARIARPSIADLAVQNYDVVVAAGSTSLRATIGRTSDVAADLDLFVYNCTSGTCVLAGQAADGDSEESVTINNPAAGAWRVTVDGYDVPAGTTEYDYIDVFAAPGFGTVAVTDANADRTAGSSWTVPGTVTVTGGAGSGRVLRGELTVQTTEGAIVGRGAVLINNVA